MHGASHHFAAIAWTLLHSLWQGGLASASYAVCRRATKSASLRYVVGHTCLAMFLIAQMLTFAIADSSPLALTEWIAGDIQAQPIGISGQTVMRKLPAVPFANVMAFVEPALPWFGVLWLSFAAARLTWFAVLFATLQIELRRCAEVAAPAIEKLRALAERTRVRARFLESSAISVPGTVGWLRPVVLVPVGWITSTPACDVEAIILHELAHIARRDFLGKLLLAWVRALYYFHLPLLWLGKQLEEDAEQATDVIAVKAHGDYEAYGAAFLRLEITSSRLSLAISAAGGTLATRLRHLVETKHGRRGSARRFSAAAITCLLAILGLGYTAASTSSNYAEVDWLQKRDLTTSVVETLGSPRPNPEAEGLLAKLRSNPAPSDKDLRELASLLRAGFDPTLFRREAELVPMSDSVTKASLPTFGTFSDRKQLVKALRDCADRLPTERDTFTRAAIILASVDLIGGSGTLASALILDRDVMKDVELDAVSRRRLEYAVALHNARIGSLIKLTVPVQNEGVLSDDALGAVRELSRFVPSFKRRLQQGPNVALRDQLTRESIRTD